MVTACILISFCTQPDVGTTGVQDHTIHGHASDFSGSMCDNEDAVVKLS